MLILEGAKQGSTAWESTVRRPTMLRATDFEFGNAQTPTSIQGGGLPRGGLQCQGLQCFRLPIGDLEMLIPERVHKAGVYIVEAHNAAVQNAPNY